VQQDDDGEIDGMAYEFRYRSDVVQDPYAKVELQLPEKCLFLSNELFGPQSFLFR